jgi:glycosyltransferase involved in cell wall biosynthesis
MATFPLENASMNETSAHEATEASRKKYRVLFIHPGAVPPNRDPRKNLHYHISGFCEGDLISTLWGRRRDLGDKSPEEVYNTLGSFRYHATFSVGIPQPFKMFWYMIYYLRKGLELSRTGGPFDVISCYGPFRCAIAGWIISRLTGAKLIIEVPGPPTEGFIFEPGLWSKIKLRVARLYVPYLLRRADGLRLYYPTQLDDLGGGGFPPAFVFPDLVPVSVFANPNEAATGDDGHYILFLGFPFKRKGVDILIQSFNQISEKYPDLSLRIVGYCPDLGPYKELAGQNNRISFHPGVPHEQAVELIANCTLFVLPSRAEGVPRALIEAMALSKPVVATRVSGIPCLIQDGSNGLLVEPDDVNDLATKMDHLLEDPELARRLAEESCRHVFQELSESRFVEQFHAMLVTLLEPGAREESLEKATVEGLP